MRIRPYAAAGLAVAALFAPSAGAAAPNTSLVVTDPSGDANFSALHGGAAPIPNQAGQDIVSVALDTTKVATKAGKKTVWTPTGLKVVITFAQNVSTAPFSSYGVNATHSACESMRVQMYYTPTGLSTFGDFANCGTEGTSGTQFFFTDAMKPKVEGKTITVELPFKVLPKQVKGGTVLSGIAAYSAHAEPAYGYQSTDFGASEGTIDLAATEKTWKIA